ncbi:MAG: 39S ribosomal protein L45 [Burkholderiaceae bacterium]|jgi:predicted lipid-binding transport protein (Tim44 family)|nr:39S ribosomal protein L45 [Burkholderiaceae bacterium]
MKKTFAALSASPATLWVGMMVCVFAGLSVHAGAAGADGSASLAQQSSHVVRHFKSAVTGQHDGRHTPAPPAAPQVARDHPSSRSSSNSATGGLGATWPVSSPGLGPALGAVWGGSFFVVIGVLAMLARRRLFAVRADLPRRRGKLILQNASGGNDPGDAIPPRQYSPRNVGNDASAWPGGSGAGASDSVVPSAKEAAGDSAARQGQRWGVPADFDAEGFLQMAKRNFVILQDAWDRADMVTLRSMMTDAMVSEISPQLAERERHTVSQPNKTEVLTLDARLLGIQKLPDGDLASVEFSGAILEDISAGPNPFREIWNMYRPAHSASGWLVAGVQALQ